MPSQNKLIVQTLINTFQRELKPEKVYEATNKMSSDLNKVFDALFDGPLPAVDGFALIRLNAAVLEGEIPESFNIAYTDINNVFDFGQTIIQNDDETPFLLLGFGNVSDPTAPIDPSSYLRLGSLTDGEFFLSQNMLWDGVAFDRDDNAIGALKLDFISGDLAFTWWDDILGDFRSTWSFSGREIFSGNFADDDVLSVALVDDNDVIRLGESAATDTTPSGYIAIPAKDATQIPLDGDADNDGIICFDKTNKYIVAYISGRRYRTAALTLYP